MKPLHLNLAARPYRDYRPLYAVVVTLSVLIAFLALKNIETYFEYVNATRSTRANIAKLDAQAAQERRRSEVLRNQLGTIDVGSLNRQARFVNARLAERTFSWSELLDRLEDVLADDVRIKSISPRIRDDGWVHLNLSCESKSTNGMIETINALHERPHFANPFPSNETLNDKGVYTFGISVDFRPSMVKVVR